MFIGLGAWTTAFQTGAASDLLRKHQHGNLSEGIWVYLPSCFLTDHSVTHPRCLCGLFFQPGVFLHIDWAYAWVRTRCVRQFFCTSPSKCANQQPQIDPRCRFPALDILEVGPACRHTCQRKCCPRNAPGVVLKRCQPRRLELLTSLKEKPAAVVTRVKSLRRKTQCN